MPKYLIEYSLTTRYLSGYGKILAESASEEEAQDAVCDKIFNTLPEVRTVSTKCLGESEVEPDRKVEVTGLGDDVLGGVDEFVDSIQMLHEIQITP